MDAPKCRLCGKRHYGLCLAELESHKERAERVTPEMLERMKERLHFREGMCPTCGTNLKAKEARKKYMRDYMARKRDG